MSVGIAGAVLSLSVAYRPPEPLSDLGLRIVVNLPAYRLDAFAGDTLVATMAVAVGMPRFPTPRGEFEITSIDWNPRWVPPASPWAAKEKPMEPGPANPMGRVKLNFRPLYFLHGTPAEQSIGSAASHGCIRLHNEDAVALALLVQRFGAPRLADSASEAMARDSGSRTVTLDVPAALSLRYDLVEATSDSVHVYPDIYGLAPAGLRAEVYVNLARVGIDTLRLDELRVRQLVARLPRSGRAAAISSLSRVPARRDSSDRKSGAR
jgi:murein L,D-transpeptidase YcbB/YkuD